MAAIFTFLDVGSFLPDDVRVLRERDVNLESDFLRLGIQVCQNQFSRLLHVDRQSYHLHLGVWGNEDMETWRHGGMETWRYGGMGEWRYGRTG